MDVDYHHVLDSTWKIVAEMSDRLTEKYPSMARHKGYTCDSVELLFQYFGWIVNDATDLLEAAAKSKSPI